MEFNLPKDAEGRECEDELASLSWADGVLAPVDADGETVPLNTWELYTDDGETVKVGSIIYNRYSWYVRSSGSGGLYLLDTLHRTKLDSWEKLEEDSREISKGTVCHYFHKGDSDVCEGCSADGTGSCWPTMARDITSRIRKLRGEDDA